MGKGKLPQLRFHSANKRTRQIALLAVASLVASTLWLSGIYVAEAVKTSWNERRLNELVENVIRRAEFAIDNVILAEVDLLSAGHSTCNADTIRAVREAIYAHSALVDVQLHSPTGTCQAFEDIGLDQTMIMAAKDGALSARNSAFRFMPLSDETSLGLGVIWEFRPDHVMTAVIRTDGLLFDMLPAAIRDHTDIALSLDNGAVVAQYAGQDGSLSMADDPNILGFSASSQRFPLTTQLWMPKAQFHAWHDTFSPMARVAMALISIVLGVLIAFGLVRAPSERDLLQAGLRTGEVKPFFQPIVCLATHKILGCEVLARWIKPDGSYVSPAVFIPLAELTGLSDVMTRSLMRQTGRDLGPALAHRSDFKINFNLTARQLANPRFADDFLTHAEACHLRKDQLVVELVERDSMDCLDATKSTLARLQSRGVRVALDDVGTGQNGLALLQSLGADIVKIDKLFVDLIDEDASSRSISEMLVRIAQSSNMRLVAEGIEREQQAATLHAMGIQEAQGFYFSKPLSADDFVQFLDADDMRADLIDDVREAALSDRAAEGASSGSKKQKAA